MLDKLIIKMQEYIHNETDECINYPILGKDGYGEIQYRKDGRKKHISAHRLVYQIVNNCTLTKDDVIMHTCDNRSCCNYKHLKKGTHKDNVQDKVNKQRQAVGENNGRYINGYNSKYNPVDKPKTPFENLHSRKFTKEKAKEIKDLIINYKKEGKSLKQLSVDINVSYSTIRDFSCGRIYKEI